MLVYEVENLDDARAYLNSANDKIILCNPQGSTRYYGMRVIDYIFKTLKNEFPDKVGQVVINAYDDYSAFVTARQLGYDQINYFNRS